MLKSPTTEVREMANLGSNAPWKKTAKATAAVVEIMKEGSATVQPTMAIGTNFADTKIAPAAEVHNKTRTIQSERDTPQ